MLEQVTRTQNAHLCSEDVGFTAAAFPHRAEFVSMKELFKDADSQAGSPGDSASRISPFLMAPCDDQCLCSLNRKD